MEEWVLKLVTALTSALQGKPKSAKLVFTLKQEDFPVCYTRILRAGRGFPWQRQIGAHRSANGHLDLRPIDTPKPEDRIIGSQDPPKQLPPH